MGYISFMDTIHFAVSIDLIITSGALAPGPLFFQTISQGTKIGVYSGLIFAIALTVFEFSLIMLLDLGFLAVRNEIFI